MMDSPSQLLVGALEADRAATYYAAARDPRTRRQLENLWSEPDVPDPKFRATGEAVYSAMVAMICDQEHRIPDAFRYVARQRLLVSMLMLRDVPADLTAQFLADEYHDDQQFAAAPEARDRRAAARMIQHLWAAHRVPAPNPELDPLTEAEYSARIAALLDRFDPGHGAHIVARDRAQLAAALQDPAKSDEQVVRTLMEKTGRH